MSDHRGIIRTACPRILSRHFVSAIVRTAKAREERCVRPQPSPADWHGVNQPSEWRRPSDADASATAPATIAKPKISPQPIPVARLAGVAFLSILLLAGKTTLAQIQPAAPSPQLRHVPRNPVHQGHESPHNPAARRSAAFLARRGTGRPGESVPAAILFEARAHHAALVRKREFASDTQTNTSVWQPVGPPQVDTAAWNLVTGRVTSLAADPSDATGNTVYVGTTGGGVWKSTNAAGSASSVSFTPLTDDLSAFSSAASTSLSIGAVSVQPGGTGVILAGTGDPNDATDSWYGAGILRSTDGGATWTLITTTAVSPFGYTYSFLGNAFSGFAWSSANRNLVVAAVTQSQYSSILGPSFTNSILGLYYSQDAGATWQLATIEDGTQVIQSVSSSIAGGNPATAVVWNPLRQRFYAAVRYHGYYESTDGITWTRLTNQPGLNLTTSMCPTAAGQPGSPACPIFRGALAVQPLTGDMFALTVDGNNIDQGLWQDVCSLQSGTCASGTVQFATQIADQPLDDISGDGTIPQGDYNLALAAVPSQQDTLLFAGTADLWRCSLANSCVWRNTTNTQTCAAAQVAPAQHAIESTFGATGLLYFGNDGGLWRSADNVAQQSAACSSDDPRHFQNLNSGLGSLAEVESFSEDPNNPSTWLAALGALGTAAPANSSGPWNQVLNGEGSFVAIDPNDSGNWYATSQFGVGINQCTQGLACDLSGFGSVAIGETQVDDDVQTIPAPWILDPGNTQDLILGTCRLWRGPASGAGWGTANLLSGMLDADQEPFCDGNAEIRTVAAGVTQSAPGSEYLYAGMAGPQDGGGLVPGHLFAAAISSISAPSNTTWTDQYSSPVTNHPTGASQFNPGGFDISSIYADPHDPSGQTVYVTIQGYSGAYVSEPLLYRSTDAGAHWLDISANLPNAPANSVVVDPNNPNIVYVATDTGVYFTQDVSDCIPLASVCWNVMGSGLPNAPVISLMTYNQGATQTLRAATYGRGIWQIDLLTAGTTPTTATVAPASLTFAPQQVETASTAQTVTVTNTGTFNLNVNTVGISGYFTETDSCAGQSIAPKANCSVQVQFLPTQTGARPGTLTITANVAGAQLTVPLSGTGLAPGVMILTPPSLSFGPETVGAGTAAQSISVANTGGSPVALTSETVSGDFAITANTCGASLAASTSCAVSIAFQPTAAGARTGVLSVSDALGIQTVLLSGTGQTVATDSLSPASLTFAPQQIGTTSATQSITLTNIGDQPLTNIAVSVTGDFTAVNNCGSLLQGHSSCAIPVAYVPTRTGAESGTLTVTDEFRTQTATLSGAGLAPPGVSATPLSINFGGLAAGTTSNAQTVTVTNSGGYALTSLTASITAGFAIAANNCPATLPVAAACQLGITFSPPSAGSVTGTLTIAASNLSRTLSVSLTGAGEDFSLAVSGSSSAVITSGQTAGYTLQLGGLSGTSGTVALACTGAPQHAACSLNPASIAVSGANTSTVTVSIATGLASSSSLLWPRWTGAAASLALALPLCTFARRRKAALFLLVFAAVLWLPLGCGVAADSGSGGGGKGGGGGGGNQNATPTGTYTITITGTMSNITHSTTLTLTVQ